MSDDSSLRDFTSERAYNLSMVAKEISEKKSYENFELLYYDYDIDVAMDLHESRGGERWQLIARISTSIIFLQILIFKKVKRDSCGCYDAYSASGCVYSNEIVGIKDRPINNNLKTSRIPS